MQAKDERSISRSLLVVVTQPGTAERRVVQCEGRVVAGRMDDCEIVLANPLVSRRHVELERVSGGAIRVRDLDSRNGTRVNGTDLRGGEMLCEGEATLLVGPYQLTASGADATATETTMMAADAVIGRCYLDRGLRTFFVDGNACATNLAGREYALLDCLTQHAPNVVPNTALGDAIWGEGQWDVYMLHNLIRRVRKKIERADLAGDEVIVTVAGAGYRVV